MEGAVTEVAAPAGAAAIAVRDRVAVRAALVVLEAPGAPGGVVRVTATAAWTEAPRHGKSLRPGLVGW